MAGSPFPCSPVHLLYPLAQRDLPIPPPDISGHFRTFSTRNRGGKRGLPVSVAGGVPIDAMRLRGRIFHAAGGTNSAFFGMNSALFCFFLYEFCFFLHVFCCMLGTKPRYSAEKRVVSGRKSPKGVQLFA